MAMCLALAHTYHTREIIEGGSETNDFADDALKVRHFVLHLLKGRVFLEGLYFFAECALACEVVRELVHGPGQGHCSERLSNERRA